MIAIVKNLDKHKPLSYGARYELGLRKLSYVVYQKSACANKTPEPKGLTTKKLLHLPDPKRCEIECFFNKRDLRFTFI